MRMIGTLRTWSALLVGAAALLSGCSSSDSTAPSGSGKVSVLLTDAPGDVQAAVVTISKIYLQGDSGQVVLSDTAVTTDLLTLADSTGSLVEDVVVPAGSYSQLRFVVTGAYLQVDNGDGTSSLYATSPTYEGLPPGAQVDGTLQAPSLGQSGLKVTLPGDALTVPDGGTRILLVDFNVAQSFGHQAGQSGMWVMHPVITGADFTTTGSATVTLTAASGVTLPGGALLSDLAAVLTAGDNTADTVRFSDDNQDGTFEASFGFKPSGDYSLDLALPAGVTSVTTDPALPATVTVVSGQSVTTDLSLTAAN